MDRKSASEKGLRVHDISPSMLRRCECHNYSGPGHYMITIVTTGRSPLLGTLIGDEKDARVLLSPLGETIYHEEIKKISLHYPMVQVWKTCIMPDHVHIILRVDKELPAGKHLGIVMRGFKAGCTRAWWHIEEKTRVKARGTKLNPADVSCESNVPAAFTAVTRKPLFAAGYNDRILSQYGQLDRWKQYLDDNPRRLMIKRMHPDLFTTLYDQDIAGFKCQLIGNRFLLDIPDKAAVIIHHEYTMDDCNRLRDQWLATGESGGVLVSAAIAPMEKKILREAMERGHRIILLRDNGFSKYYKPSGENFYACSNGQLLQISPWPYHTGKIKITRQQCLMLNRIAEAIVSGV